MGSLVRGHQLKAVLVDVGGTLIEVVPEPSAVYAATLSRYGPPLTTEEVAPVFSQVWQEMTQEHPRGLDRYHLLKGGEKAWWGRFLREVLARLQHPAPWEEVLEELFTIFARPQQWRVYSEVKSVLTKLKDSGVLLAVVSNWDSRLPALLAGLDLVGFFRELVVSALEGVEKPHPEIFARALERLGVAPEEATHWGDSPLDDYRGAEACGITPVLIDRRGLFPNGYTRAGNLEEAYELCFAV